MKSREEKEPPSQQVTSDTFPLTLTHNQVADRNAKAQTGKMQPLQLLPAPGRGQRTQPFVRHSLFEGCSFAIARGQEA